MTRNASYIAIFTTAFAICCSGAQASDVKSVNLRPGKVHESCHKLAAGSKLSYSFQVSSETLFNIHYHAGKEINYPTKEHLALNSSDTVNIDATQTYCLMWTNPQSHTVTLRYHVELPPA